MFKVKPEIKTELRHTAEHMRLHDLGVSRKMLMRVAGRPNRGTVQAGAIGKAAFHHALTLARPGWS